MSAGGTPTPYVTVDPERLEANLRQFDARARAAGVAVRAHIKGHRTVPVATRQIAAGAVGIAVHAAAETESYVDAGVPSVVVAWPWRDDWRWPRFVALARRCAVTVNVDRPETLDALSAAATAGGVAFGVRIEVDPGLHRVGVPPDEVAGLAMAAARAPGLHLDGVTAYSPDGGTRVAGELVAVAEAIRAKGLDCPVVSVGGTVTAAEAMAVPGVTEVCVGAYALYDGGHALLGACRPDDVAIAVTTTVTGRGPDGTPLTDADELLAGADQTWAPGVRMTDECGAPITTASVGDRIRVLPGHVCPVVARCPTLHLPDGATWQPHVAPDRP